MLYQKGIDEELSCPADAKHSITGTCCKTLADNLLGCCLIDYLPNTTVDVANMDVGDGVQATFQCNRAKWHDYCRLAFNSSQLFRAEEMGTTPCEDIAEVLQKYSQGVDETPHSKDKFFFCDHHDSNDETLNVSSTFQLDIHGRKCPLKLGEMPLLAKLSAGD